MIKLANISIIVPVYRVEEYLAQCVDSILSQTYRDFELLLIDDGSPDSCGEICEEYARKDGRIKVFHIKNGGSSAARNFGLQHASGKYITFIDSDDWVEPDMLEYLLGILEKFNAQVATCGAFLNYENKEIAEYEAKDAVLLSSKESFKKLIYHQTFTNYACSKLYSRDLFSETHFPPKILNGEDFVGVSKVLFKAERIAHSTVAKYHYRQRLDSAVRGSDFKKRSGVVQAVQMIGEQAVKIYPDLAPGFVYLYTEANLQMIDNAPDIQRARPYLKNIRPYFLQVIADRNVVSRYKRKLLVVCMGLRLYQVLRRIYQGLSINKLISHNQ